LRIEVDDQRARAALRGDGGEIAGDRAFADAAFLIENNAFHDDLLMKGCAIFAYPLPGVCRVAE